MRSYRSYRGAKGAITLKLVLMLVATVGLLLVLACGSLSPPTPSSAPVTTPTPDIEATVETLVERKLAEAFAKTATAAPPPTPSANISAVEAKGRLRIYFQDVEERRETFLLHKSLMAGWPVPPGCDPVGIMVPRAYENCPQPLKSYAEETALETRKESARAGVCPREYSGCSNMTAEYHGQGTWLITVRGTLGRFHTTAGFSPQEFEEQWWLFESGVIPPRKSTD